jgi:hypothetical protein
VIAGYILGILAMTIVVFLIVHYVILGRAILTEKKWKKTGKLTARGHAAGVRDVEVLEISEEKTLY